MSCGCGNSNSLTSCTCSDNCPNKTSDITLFDGNFSSIVVPEGAGLNEVLALLESYVMTSVSDLNLTFPLGLNCLGLDPGTYGYNQIFQAIINQLCSMGGGSTTLFKSMPIQLSIDEPYGFPFTGEPYQIPVDDVVEITPITLEVVTAGDYIISSEFVLDSGDPKQRWIGYELRVNGVVVPYSTRVVRIFGGTPADNINSFSVSSKAVGLSAGDEISLWVSNTFVEVDSDIIIVGGSLEARSF
jgi:hypothetical protein